MVGGLKTMLPILKESKTKKLVLLLIFSMICLSIVFLDRLYHYTYIWQSTSLASSLSPRSHCDFNKMVADESNKKLRRGYNTTAQRELQHLRIAILMVYSLNWKSDILLKIVENRHLYSAAHNNSYEVIDGSMYINNTKPIAWNKLSIARTLIASKQYDYLLYIDMDAVVMNPDISIESVIHASSTTHDILITSDFNGLNTGVFIVKATEWSEQFLELAWNQDQLVPKHSSETNASHPFKYEQRAFHYLLNTEQWRALDLPAYHGDSEEIKRHFYFLPQCAMNSYTSHPLDFRGGTRKAQQYVNYDFIIHLAGKTGETKQKLIQHYLKMAKQRMESRINNN